MKPKRSSLFLLAAATIVFTSSAFADPVIKSGVAGTTDLTAGTSWAGIAPTTADIATWLGTSLGGTLALNQTDTTTQTWGAIEVQNASTDIVIGTTGLGNAAAFSTGATQITVATPAGLSLGSIIAGTGIATGTTVTAISGSTLTLSTATTGANAGTAISVTPLTLNLTGNQTVQGVANTGIYLAATGKNLTINQGLTPGGPQTWFLGAGRTLRLNGVGTGSNALTLSGTGTMVVGNSAAFGTGDIAVTDSLKITNEVGFANNISIATGKTLSIGPSSFVFNAVSGVISGDGNLTASGNVRLTGNNTFTGNFRATGGNITITKDAALGASTNTVTFAGGILSTYQAGAAVNLTRNIDLSSNTTVDMNANDLSLGGIISGAGGFGIGSTNTARTMTLSGPNTYTGATSVAGSTLSINSIKNADGISASALGKVTSANRTIGINNATLRYTGAGDTTDRVINLSGTTGGATLDQSGASVLTFTSAFTATGAGSKTLTLQGSTVGSGEISGAIVNNSVTNTTSVTKAGTGTWKLSGTNTYTGATTVNAGVLNITGSLTSAVTVNSGGLISGNGNGTTTGVTTGLLTLNTGSSITLAGGSTLTSLKANGVNFAGATNVVISTPLVNGNTYDVVTYGAGGVTNFANLSGPAYRGGLINDSGNQKITLTANFGTRTWNTTTGTWGINTGTNFTEGDQKFFNNDSVVFGDITANAAVTLNGRLAPASVVVSNNNAFTYTLSGTAGTNDITGTTSLTKSGAGTLILNSAHTYSGGTTIDGGTLKLESGASLGTGAITINNTGKLSINNSVVLDSAAPVTVNTGGTFEFLSTVVGQDFSGTVILNGGKLLNNAWMFSYKPIVLNAGDQTVEVGANNFHLYNSNGKFTGVGNLIKEGVSSLSTSSGSGASDFTGTTTVNKGALIFVTGGGGFTATSAVTIAANATVDIRTNERLNDAAFVAANGSFKLSGAVTETIASLNGASTGQVSNGTTNTVATLVTGANNGTGSFAGTIVNGAAGNMALTKIGTGTQTLSGTNTYTGDTTVSGGTLSLATASLADTSTVSIATGATLDLTHGTTDRIGSLVINGVQKAKGLYKSSTAGGAGIVLASLTGTGKLQVGSNNTFGSRMSNYDFAAFPGANLTANGDADGDGISNLLEEIFGTAPNAATTGFTQTSATASSLTFKHPVNASLAADVTYSYQWSSDLAEWKSSGQSNNGGTTATIAAGTPISGEVTVTTTISEGPTAKVFVRIIANQAP